MPILLDLTHTSHTRARTGVQRVALSLRRALAERAMAVTFDPFEGAWRPLEDWEEENLVAAAPPAGRAARWPLAARIRGRLRRLLRGSVPLAGGPHGGVVVPEIFSPGVAAALPSLFAATPGPRVALFHDAIALKYPESSPRATVARFPAYLRQLLAFDGVAAVSEESRESLAEYWRWLGIQGTPVLAALPLGIDSPPPGDPAPARPEPTVLCVGSIEARKNHLALLDACESLWSRGVAFRLRLIGLVNAETGGPALERLKRLKSAGRPILFGGAQGDEALESAYRECAFTVYPSLAEGFGLPVAESLARGKPCLCRTVGALGEIAAGGGCVSLGSAGSAEIAAAIGRLIEFPAELSALGEAAQHRRFASWAQYCAGFLDWMASLPRHG